MLKFRVGSLVLRSGDRTHERGIVHETSDDSVHIFWDTGDDQWLGHNVIMFWHSISGFVVEVY